MITGFLIELLNCIQTRKTQQIDSLFENSWKVLWNTGIYRGIIDSYCRLSAVEYQLKNFSKSVEYINYGLTISHQRKYALGISVLMQRLGAIKQAQCCYDEALSIYKDVLTRVQTIGKYRF